MGCGASKSPVSTEEKPKVRSGIDGTSALDVAVRKIAALYLGEEEVLELAGRVLACF